MTSERDAFYESFWVTPEIPIPQMKAGVVVMAPSSVTSESVLNATTTDVRLKLKNRLRLLDVAREGDLANAIETCKLYCQHLRSEEDIPLTFELPMVLFTRAILLLNQAKCVSRSRDREEIPQAATFCLEAAGIFDHILELMNANLMEGLEPPCSLPDLSLDVLQSLQGVCLAIAQQLSIVKAVLHFDKPYSKSVLVKLHGGCQASFQIFEAALLRNCSSSANPPSRHAKTLLSFASFFGRLHKAQVFLLSAELEHHARNFGQAIAYAEIARKLFQERTSIGGLGLPPHPENGSERIGSVLMAKRAALDQLHADWTSENDSIYFERIPHEDGVLSTALPQAFIMKPQVFDPEKDAVEHTAGTTAGLQSRNGHPHDCAEQPPDQVVAAPAADTERDETSDGDLDETGKDSTSAIHSEVHLERAEFVCKMPSDEGAQLASVRRSIITELSDIMFTTNASEISPTAVAARRRSERPPSMIAVQPGETSTSRRNKSVDFEYKANAPAAPKPETAMVEVQERPTSVALHPSSQTPLPLPGVGKPPSKLNVVQPEVQGKGTPADQQMRDQLTKGKPIFRLSKDTRWKKEMMYLINDEIIFIRKKPLMFSTQKKVVWSSIQAIQLEQGEVKDTNFILIVAKNGEELTPFEFTTNPPTDNPLLFNYLHRLFQEKRKKSVQSGASFRPLQRQHTIS